MRKFCHLLLAANLLILNELAAQNDTSRLVAPALDRDPFPIFSMCQTASSSELEQKNCAFSELQKLIERDLRCPDLARKNGASGEVIVEFLVRRDGSLGDFEIRKDLGWGCGEEAVRVLRRFSKKGIRWQPALIGKNPVAKKVQLPVQFRCEPLKNWRLGERRDTIFEKADAPAAFKMGVDSLRSFIVIKTNYPSAARIDCRAGRVDVELLVRRDGSVRVENVQDFGGLGPDFQYEAIRTGHRMAGQIEPARLAGRPVGSIFPFRIDFKSSANECAAVNENFSEAMVKADSAVALERRGLREKAIEKASEALFLRPDSGQMLWLRGFWHFQNGRKDAACEDWSRCRKLVGVTWFEQIRRLACGF